MSEKIKGRITNYHIGIKSQQSKECLIEFKTITSVGALVGQKVVWVNGKNRFPGKIVGLHGRNGIVRVRFARPVPGQAIGTDVEIIH